MRTKVSTQCVIQKSKFVNKNNHDTLNDDGVSKIWKANLDTFSLPDRFGNVSPLDAHMLNCMFTTSVRCNYIDKLQQWATVV
jgi:hypothetical protein